MEREESKGMRLMEIEGRSRCGEGGEEREVGKENSGERKCDTSIMHMECDSVVGFTGVKLL